MTATTDRLAIADLTARLAHTQDTRDWQGLRALLADTVHLDISRHLGAPPTQLTATQFTDRTRAVLCGFPATHHATGNLVIDLHDLHADCRAHVVAHHHLPVEPQDADTETGTAGQDEDAGEYCTMRGFWHLRARRDEERWLVESLTVIRTMPLEGNAELYRRTIAAGAAHPDTQQRETTP